MASAALMTETSVAFSSSKTNQDLQISIAFRPSSHHLSVGDKVYLYLPHFTRSSYVQGKEGGAPGLDLAFGTLELYPSIFWTGQWSEGGFCGSCSNPFSTSLITIELRTLEAISPSSLHSIVIDASNGIMAYCGHSTNSSGILIGTDASGSIQTQQVENSAQIGSGCHNDCTNHGTCDHCLSKCACDEGYGSPIDITIHTSIDCSDRICSWGRASVVPIAENQAHAKAECSNNGLCNRGTGECECFHPWEGGACDRHRCPQDCSGHGMCASMLQLSRMAEALPLTSSTTTIYGSTDEAKDTTAWDHDSLQSCVCDSDWTVGLGSGEVHEPQWFGPDCSRQHCPSGDDPEHLLMRQTARENLLRAGMALVRLAIYAMSSVPTKERANMLSSALDLVNAFRAILGRIVGQRVNTASPGKAYGRRKIEN